MAELNGTTGAIYKAGALNYGLTIAFVDSNPDTITDTASGFTLANGFTDSTEITVYGSTSNDGDYTVASRADGTLTLDAGDSLTAEAAGDKVWVYEKRPGTEIAGFHNWTLDNGVDMLDVTDFSDAGYRTFIAGIKAWTATADRHYLTDDTTPDDDFGTVVWVRFFVRYDASPDVTNAYFLEGPAYVSGISTSVPIDGIVEETITFTGIGPLQTQTQSIAW